MSSKDDRIREILEKYDEPWDASTVWRVQGTPVLYHAALERIAGKAGIRFGEAKMIRAERDECVVLVTGWIESEPGVIKDEVWTFGEALIGANYRVSGKQAAYVYAMAEKRGKDRVILKLLGLTEDDALDEASAREKEEDARREVAQEQRQQQQQQRAARTPSEAVERLPPSRQIKARMCEALFKLKGPEVDVWLKGERVVEFLAKMDEVDRLDVERFAAERAELE